MKSSRYENGGLGKRPLPYAWERWNDLQQIADAFLALPEVQRALTDEMYRLGDFQRHWKKAPTNIQVQQMARRYHGMPINDLATFATILRAMANQTQKHLVKKNSPTGMREMTVIQEWTNLLLDGKTLRGSYEALEFVKPPSTAAAIEGLRIHAITAIEILLRVTKGDLDPEWEKPLVTKCHGLSVVSSYASNNVSLPWINMVGSKEEIDQGYSYGNASEEKMRDRIQGAEFRLLQMREFGNERLAELAKEGQWQKPSTRLFTTVIGSEVCTESALKSGMSPTFGERQWGIGPKAADGQSIDFRRGDIQTQILNALPLITEILLHYPTDAPAVRKK